MGLWGVCSHWRGIWGWLWFSCRVMHCRGDLVSVFGMLVAGIGGVLAGGLGTILSFYEV